MNEKAGGSSQSHSAKSKSASIGIDVCGTKVFLRLFDGDFDVVDEIRFAMPKARNPFTTALRRSVDKLVKKAGASGFTVTAVGIGAAGSIIRAKGTIDSAPNLPFLSSFSFTKALTTYAAVG
jgi:predicted NBD/HSP70 family sugar kinase